MMGDPLFWKGFWAGVRYAQKKEEDIVRCDFCREPIYYENKSPRRDKKYCTMDKHGRPKHCRQMAYYYRKKAQKENISLPRNIAVGQTGTGVGGEGVKKV
jgi:hypothetical protein